MSEEKKFRIEVENRFKNEKRDLLVYNSLSDSYSIVRWPGEGMEAKSTVFTITEEKHLLITLAPKHAEKPGACWVELPLIATYDFNPFPREKSRGFSIRLPILSGEPPESRTRVDVNREPHEWQLMVTAPSAEDYVPLESATQDDTVRVGDNG